MNEYSVLYPPRYMYATLTWIELVGAALPDGCCPCRLCHGRCPSWACGWRKTCRRKRHKVARDSHGRCIGIVYRTVRGISFIFVGIDALGDVFSLLSVVCQPTLDILGIVIYGTELVLWIGIFVCGAHYNLLPWLKEHHTQLEGGLTATVGVRLESATIGSGIALHDLPSSTSVFRTPSAAFEATRRAVNVRASGQDVQGPAR
jgi:hypothetical protein